LPFVVEPMAKSVRSVTGAPLPTFLSPNPRDHTTVLSVTTAMARPGMRRSSMTC
jgi:hypothetical protein